MNRNDMHEEQHETSDIRVRAILKAVVVFVIAAVVIHVGVWWMYDYYRRVDTARDVRRTLVDAPPPVPPEPRLQISPSQELQEYRREQQQILDSYGWVSREEGRVRIPIRRAMDLVIERGLPTRTAASQEQR